MARLVSMVEDASPQLREVMAALTPYAKWVALAFIRGTSLDDADDLLEGTGKTVRHVKLRTSEELRARRVAIRKLIEGAARSGD